MLGMVGALSGLSACLAIRTINHVFADEPRQLSVGLSRCALCRSFTRSVPVIVVRNWRLHAPVCLECSMADVDPPNLGLFPLHHAPLKQIAQAVRIGNIVWDIR